MATMVGPEVQWIANFLQAGAELPSARRDHGCRRGNVTLSQAIWGVNFGH